MTVRRHPLTMKNKTCQDWKLTVAPIPAEQKIQVSASPTTGTVTTCATVLLSAKESTECDDTDHLIQVKTSEEEIKDNVATATFSDLLPGVYCVAVTQCESGKYTDVCHAETNLTAVCLSADETTPPVFTTSTKNEADKIVYSILGATLAFTIITLLVLLHLRRKQREHQPPLNRNEREDEKKEVLSNQNVFLIYSRDCKEHISTVKAFAEFLEKTLNFKVSYDENELSQIMVNPHAWIQGVNYTNKIIVISSEGAYLQQHSWLKHKVALANRWEEQDYFLALLAQLSPMQKQNYRDVVNVRFMYTDTEFMLRDVVSLTHYSIPQDLNHLVTVLNNDLPKTWDQGDTDYQKFLLRTEECRQFLNNNNDYIRTSLTPYEYLETTQLDQNQPTETIHFTFS